MIIFMTVFFSIYGGMHLYGFLRVRRVLSLGHRTSIPLAVFMALMVLAPILIRNLERHGFASSARILAHVGYTWMGFIFLFICVAFILDIYRLLIHLACTGLHIDLSEVTLSAGRCLFISLLLAIIISIYGAFEAVAVRTETVTIKTPKISKTVGRLRIAQISDVHLGLIVGEGRMENILARVKSANPDILVSTGDLVDGQMDGMEGLIKLFKNIQPKYGKFAITGNHEFYAGIERSLDFIRRAGFTVLRGQGHSLAGVLTIVGVDDPVGRRFGPAGTVLEKELLSGFPHETFTLFLKHRPVIDKDASGFFDLQLSGHTHKGQIFPFSMVVKFYYPNLSGLFELEHKSRLYVSRGSGTWGPPIRFLAAPEVTLIDLVHEDTEP
jgi:predicted MPP superfamily phosphohydrolase